MPARCSNSSSSRRSCRRVSSWLLARAAHMRAPAMTRALASHLVASRSGSSRAPVTNSRLGAMGLLALVSGALVLAADEDTRQGLALTSLAHAQCSAPSMPLSAALKQLSSNAAIEQTYEITDEIIGEGGYCVVRRGVDRRTGEHVAVKILSKSETNAREFWTEVDVLRVAGKHPNIMQLRAVFETEDCWYIVQDLAADGELFDHLIANGAYSEQQASEAVRDLCDALHYLHRKGIVHGDIKPENILLHNGRMCLVDFGVSFRMGERFIGDSQLTGTVAYAAPETLVYGAKDSNTTKSSDSNDSDARGPALTISTDGDGLEDLEYTKLGPKTDMFALGVVLYILLCGCHPFDRYNNLTDEEIRKRIIAGKYHTQSRAWQTISPLARDLICKLLETDPEKRLSSKQALQHPWLVNNAQLSQEPMRDSAELLEKFQRGRRRLRASIIGVLLIDALDEERTSSGDAVSDAVAQLTKDMSWGISASVEAFREKTQALLSTLDVFDKDKKGFISKTDLARVSEKLGKRMSESELNEMLVGSTGDPEYDATAADAIAYEDVKIAISTLRSASYAPGETIIREGYAGGHYVYLLLDGEVEVSCRNPIKDATKQLDSQIFVPASASSTSSSTTNNATKSSKARSSIFKSGKTKQSQPQPRSDGNGNDEPADEIVLRRLPKGSFFGEIELVRPDGMLHPRVATFRCAPASSDAAKPEHAQCKVLQLVANDFLNASGTYSSISERMGSSARRHTQQQLIKCVEAAKGSIKKRSLQAGDVLYREGEECDSFFILLEGEVEVLKQHGTVVVEELHAGDYFPLGVSGQIKPNKINTRHSTVRCTQPTRVVEIGGETFRSFLRSNQFLASYFREEVKAREQLRIDKVTKA